MITLSSTTPHLGALVLGRVRVALHVDLVVTGQTPADSQVTGRPTVLVAQPLTPVISSAPSPPPGAGLPTLGLVGLLGPVTGQTAGVAALQLVLTGQWTGG